MKDLNSFVFSFLLRMEPNEVEPTIKFIDQELGKVGQVVRKEIFTENGIDLTSFSNPSAQFIIERLVDGKTERLPVLRAQLSIKTITEIVKTKEYIPIKIKTWTVYIQDKGQNLAKALEESLPTLLRQFSSDYQSVNKKGAKPIFLITYDASWWKKAD